MKLINLIKVIIKLEGLFYQNIYILFDRCYVCRTISTQTNQKSVLVEKKNTKQSSRVVPILALPSLVTKMFCGFRSR